MKVSESILLIIFASFAGVLMIDSIDMPYSSEHGFDVGFVPLNTSVAVIVLVLLIGARVLLGRKKAKLEACASSKMNAQTSEPDQPHSLVAPASTIVLLLIATAAMGFGSILLPLAIVMTIVSKCFLGNSWFHSVRMTVLSLIVIYLIFSVWLKIPII